MSDRTVRADCASCGETLFRCRERELRAHPRTSHTMIVQAVRAHGHGGDVRFFLSDQELGSEKGVEDEMRAQQLGDHVRRSYGVTG